MATWKEFLSWEKASKDTIDFKTMYVDIVGKRGVVGNRKNKKTGEIENGDIISGLFLSQIIYWYLPSKSKDSEQGKLRVKKLGHYWIVKKTEKWYEEIRLSPQNYKTAKKRLEEENLIIAKSMKNPFDESGQSNITHIRLNIAEFTRRWNLILSEQQAEIEEADEEMNAYFEEQMEEGKKQAEKEKKDAEALSHMENVESTISKENVDSTISIQNVNSTISKESVDSTISFITESTTENITENTNKESIYHREIENLEVPAPIKKVVNQFSKEIDGLIRNNKMSLLEIELLYNNSELNVNDFATKLYDVLNKGVNRSFKGCMETAIEKFISNSNNKTAQKQKQPIRKEMVPDFAKEGYKEEKEPVTEEALLQVAELKLELQPHNLTEQEKELLKQNGLWKEPAHV